MRFSEPYLDSKEVQLNTREMDFIAYEDEEAIADRNVDEFINQMMTA